MIARAGNHVPSQHKRCIWQQHRLITHGVMENNQVGFDRNSTVRDQLTHLARRVLLLASITLRAAGPALLRCLLQFWAIARPSLRAALQLALALGIIFGEWGWRPLANLLGTLSRWQPWAALETAIARLPPSAAFVVVALPAMGLLPLKILALVLVAQGHILFACLLFVATKIVATALMARLFLLTKPALMQIGWFASSYARAIPWKEALVAKVRASRAWRMGRLWEERAKRAAAVGLRCAWPRLLALQAKARRGAWRLRAMAAPRLATLRILVQHRLVRAVNSVGVGRCRTPPRTLSSHPLLAPSPRTLGAGGSIRGR
jgi:hypothetical protein